ncbi:uncharacterized protein LOC120708725 [Panicum virgatum]|uniref:Transducin/WD40 repeat-like superfamily protein n=1 Tax=Panicum virgatum TaxID=38727 RepID=A0A8T0SVD9_PANVG|nr:uncharacterized protein LOC120708725 [Panicum virgatum]KAG2602087.1 hypothetical protein PVAP13_5KG653000 [Panicum virgatum]KAG2602088.1 hypothetical protein PVAP13_5KG653000 [Panicum virgatum]
MAAPPEAPPPPEDREGTAKDGVEVCLFDESADGFSRTVRAISELANLEPELDFPDAEVERLASSVTFLREWRHFSYEPKDISFNTGIESASSRNGMHSISLPQFSAATVPQVTQQEDRRDNTVSFDFILFAGGNVWALDWCPRLCDKPGSSINCEYLAVSAHPPGSSYHKIGMPLTGRGIIQIWCLLAPFEDAHSRRPLDACNSTSRRGRPRKIPNGTNSVGCSSNPPKPRGRPRKRPYNDQLEPVPKRPRGRPRKHPLPLAKLEDSSQNSGCQAIVLFDPLATSTGIPDDLPLAYVMPTTESEKSTPKIGRGRPRKNPSDKLAGSSATVLKEDVRTEPSPTSAICAKPKRPRGRPRKYPVPINDKSVSGADFDLGQETTCQPVSFSGSLDHTVCTEFNAIPRKNPSDKLIGSSGAVSKEDVCIEPSPTTSVCAKPKRPRGRPRKHPVPIKDTSVSGADVDLGQETTCRPVSFSCSLDNTVSTEFNANLSIVADAALPVVHKLTSSADTVVKENACIESPATSTRKQPKRTRVRPRKYSDTDIELGKDTISSPVSSRCSLDHTACTESNSNLSTVAVDAASLFTSSSTAISEKSKGQRSRAQNKKIISYELCSPVVSGVEPRSMGSREIIPNSPMASAQNMVSATSDLCSANMLNSDDNVHKGALSGDLVQPIHISPKSRQSSGRRGRGRGRPKRNPLSVGTSSLVVSGASSTKTTSVLTSSDNLTSLDKTGGEFIASNLGSSGCGIDKSSVRWGAVSSDAASPRLGLYNANCKEESSTKRGSRSRKKPVSTEHSHFTDFNGKEQKMQTNLKSSDPVVLVENCIKGPCPRKGGGQPQRIPASNESNGTSVCGETHTMERFSAPMTTASPRSEDMADEAGLIQSNNGIVGCEGMKVNESSTANVTSHCNGNAQANQAAPSFKNSDRVIDEVEATELVALKEPREDNNMFSCAENSNSSPVPKDIALPRVVLCLAHNGKVAWDIKWKPPLLSQPEQKSRLGFLAVLLGNGSLEVWEVPSPCMIQKLYSPSKVEGSDPRFLKLQPVFRSVKVKCGNRQSIPLTVDWSPSPPHDMILAGCHDGTVALWNFSTNPSSQDSKPFMCVTAESGPIRALCWAPYISENINTFVTAGADGVKFWDLRDPYRPLWELTTAPRAVLSVQWLKDGRGIVISMEDGTLKFLSLARIANDVPATGRLFVRTKTQGVSTYQLSEYLIWSVHASDTTGCAAYCGADGTAVCFQLTPRFWEKEPGRNRVPYFLCGSLSEEGENIKIGSGQEMSPLPNVPVMNQKGTKPCQNIVQGLPARNVTGPPACQLNTPTGNRDIVNRELGDDQDDGHSEEQGTGAVNPELADDQDDGDGKEQGAGAVNPELGDDQDDGHSKEQGASAVNAELADDQDGYSEEKGAGAIVLAGPTEQEDAGTLNSKGVEFPKDFEVFPPKSVALHRVRWNVNKGSERWLCYGGAAGIIRCQRI